MHGFHLTDDSGSSEEVIQGGIAIEILGDWIIIVGDEVKVRELYNVRRVPGSS